MLQTKIAARASELSRRIYASLPFEYRVARLLIKLRVASALAPGYGKIFYAEFIAAGVTGMPDVKLRRKVEGVGDSGDRVPAEALQPIFAEARMSARQNPRKFDWAVSVLPDGYGGLFGSQMWGLAKKFVGSDEGAMDVLQNVSAELLGGTSLKIKSYALSSAESWVKKMVAWRSGDYRDKSQGQDETSLVDEEGFNVDLVDKGTLRNIMQELKGNGTFQRTLREEVDPRNPDRAWDWILAESGGYSGLELAEKWGVSPSAVSQWVSRYKSDIREVIEEFV